MDKIQTILKYLNKYKFTLLFTIFLLLITYFQGPFKIHPIVNAFSILLIVGILAKTKYTLPLSIILSFIITLDAYFAFVFSGQITIEIIASIVETNISEATSVLKDTLLVGIPLLVLTTFLLLKSQSELKNTKLSRKILSIIFLIYIVIIIPGYVLAKVYILKTESKEIFYNNPLLSSQMIISDKFTIIYNDIASFIVYRNEIAEMKKFANMPRTLPHGISLDNDNYSPNKIYLVIGESSWSKHYSLYGYQIATTPFLDSLSLSTSDMNFYDAISPAPITRESLRISLTFATVADLERSFTEKNILDLANDANYETFWLSGQEHVGIHNSYLGAISNVASYSYYQTSRKKDDLDLTKKLNEIHNPSSRQFIVIHLNGSHASYSDRYDSIDDHDIPESKDKMTRNYDCSIHHTDRVLRNIYKTMKNDKSSVLIYISDHGELIGLGHGFNKAGHEQFEVPFISINNSTTPTDSIIRQYVDTQSNLINISNITPIVAEIMGYRIPDDYKKKQIIEGQYVLHSNGKVYPYSEIIDK